jgi:hypothetical protein
MKLDSTKQTTVATIAVAGLLAALLITGLIMSRQHPTDQSTEPPANISETSPTASPATSGASTPTASDHSSPSTDPGFTSATSSEKKLIASYGEHRVRQSRRIATKILALNQHIAESGGENNAKLHIARLLERDPSTLNPSDLDLPENDSPLPRPSVEELTTLSENPLPLQENLLAADASSRGILTEEQFQSILAYTSKHIPTTMLGTGNNSLSLEASEKHIEKLTKAME